MERGAEGAAAAHRTSHGRPAAPSHRDGAVLASFVLGYGVAGASLLLAAQGVDALLPEGLALLVLLSGAMFVGGILEPRKNAQVFYLALSVVPALTLARMGFGVTVQFIIDPLLVYLLLAVTILVLRQSIGARPEARGLTRRQTLRALPLGVALAAGFTVLGTLLPVAGATASAGPSWVPLVVLAPVALLDEFWFRGVLQGTLARATSAEWGWLGTAVLFVAYGAPFGNGITLLFRMAYGLAFGALAMRRENLPVSLVARTVMTVALLALSPGLAGTSLIV